MKYSFESIQVSEQTIHGDCYDVKSLRILKGKLWKTVLICSILLCVYIKSCISTKWIMPTSVDLILYLQLNFILS